MAGAAAKQAYTRSELRRLLGISERQLAGWEEQKLVATADSYGFKDLLGFQTLIKLRKNRVATSQIRRALSALRTTLRHIDNPLTELKLYADGKKIRVELDGRAMEAESGQLLLNFDESELTPAAGISGERAAPLKSATAAPAPNGGSSAVWSWSNPARRWKK